MSSLNAYEAEQVREIALWKSERPSLLLESYRSLTRPLSRLVARAVPKEMAREALRKVEKLAEVEDPASDIFKAAGISAVPNLLDRPLEECDQLSRMVSARAEHLALLEGVVPATIGAVTPPGGGGAAAVLDIPVLLEASVRAIRRIGHCYGFPLDSEADRRFLLAILDIANQDDPAGQEEDRHRLWELASTAEKKVEGSAAANEIAEAVVDDIPIESIPVVGEVANLVLDFAFIRRVDATARRVFQERWLRANGKVDSIPPAAESRRRSSIEGIVAVGSEIAYTGAYGVAFGVTFPTTLAVLAVESVAPEPILRGLRDGASAAVGDSKEFRAGLAKGLEPPTNGALVPSAQGTG